MKKIKSILFPMPLMNMQLFATQTTLLNSTGNDLSPEMKTFYDMTLLDEAQAQQNSLNAHRPALPAASCAAEADVLVRVR